MSSVGQVERATQNRVVRLFQKQLGYTYLGNWQDRANNSNIEEEYLRPFLIRQGYSETLITKAIYELRRVAGDQARSLYDINRAVYDLLRYGVKVKPDVSEQTQTVYLIDWGHPRNNDFAIAEEVSVNGEKTKRPDIVLYVNGIALGVLELKRSTVPVNNAIRQNIVNQRNDFIRPFFTTMQFVMAGNDSEGLRYGTIETTEKYYLTWKEDDGRGLNSLRPASPPSNRVGDEGRNELRPLQSVLDRSLVQVCEKERFLEIIHDFVVYDAGIKKLCRPNQYFGVRAAQKRVRSREGGIIWHTQGSGKSLTMVWLARWIREHVTDARVLIITDRTELDDQIEKVFLGVNEAIYRTKNGADLIEKLNGTDHWLLCSLIHKFSGKDDGRGLNSLRPDPTRNEEIDGRGLNSLRPGPTRNEDGRGLNSLRPASPITDRGGNKGRNELRPLQDVAAFIEEMKRSIPPGFKAKGDIYVFVDECHRTQSGEMHEAMKTLLPNAMFIGFTGTPLLKADKQKSIEVFGSYIHTYKFDEAVEDGVVLDLLYEARDIDQSITSPDKIDRWFDAKTRGLNDVALAQLKQRWGTLKKVYSSKSRLEKIVGDILMDMATQERLSSGRGNAMLVSDSIYQACKLYELFVSQGFTQCAIVTSYKPSPGDIRTEDTGEGMTEKLRQYEIYNRMLNGKDPETFEKEVKKKFVDEPGQMKLLIVVDKLLTGFDAPPATYLYIDKHMQDHGLFQAICRVNRLDGEDKTYGYIIDYKDLFKSLEQSIADYTSGALDGYDATDVKGLLKNRVEASRERLETARESIKALCEPVAPPKNALDYIRYFCGGDTLEKDALKDNEPKRIALYTFTTALIRAYANLADELPEAGYSEEEIRRIQQEVEHYTKVRTEVKRASGDAIDLKRYEPDMRYLIDNYIRAEESVKLSAFDDISLVQLIVERGLSALDDLPSDIRNNKEAMAETIENNLRRVIIEDMPINPKYYENMSELLDTLIQERREQSRTYAQYLAGIMELSNQVQNPTTGYPKTLNTPGKRSFYDNLNGDEQKAIQIHDDIQSTKKDGWRGDLLKEREVLYAIQKTVPDEALSSKLLEIAKRQNEY